MKVEENKQHETLTGKVNWNETMYLKRRGTESACLEGHNVFKALK